MILKIKVIPKAPHTEFVETMSDGTLKIRLKAVAEKGRANKELIDFLAKTCKVDKKEVSILSGKTAPHKLVKLPDSCVFPL